MNLEEAKVFRDECLFRGEISDGCTVVKDFNFTPACQIHDFLIRFQKVSRKEADDLFLEAMLEIASDSLYARMLAHVYYYAMRYVAILFLGDFTLAIGVHGFGVVMLSLYLWG